MAKPGHDEEKRESNHQDSDDLAPKTTGELMLDGSFFFAPFCWFSCRFSLLWHILLIIAHFSKKHKGFEELTEIRRSDIIMSEVGA